MRRSPACWSSCGHGAATNDATILEPPQQGKRATMGALWRGEDEVVPPASSSYLQYRRLADDCGLPRTAPRLPWTGMAHATRIVPALKGNGPPAVRSARDRRDA